MKTVLFIPGFQESFDSRDYRGVLKTIEAKGYKVKFVPIDWQRTTIDDWVEQAEKEYGKYNSSNTILAGFSYGAMTAFVVTARRRVAKFVH